MENQLSEDEFDSRCDAVLADYPEVAHRANCAAQNAEQALVQCEGYSAEEAANDLSELFIHYFSASLAGFAEE